MYAVTLPVSELADLSGLDGWAVRDALILVSGDWDEVRRQVSEGDEIALVGYVPEWPEPVAEVRAVVVGFDEETPGIEVIV